MQMHQYNVENLFCNYVNRVLMNCPFLKLKVNNSDVIISFGMEKCKYDASDTHQEFFEREKYDIQIDIDTLEKLLTVHSIPNVFCEKISKDELLLTHKKEITFACTETATLLKENMFFDFNDFMEYIKNNKRTILIVSKQRYFNTTTKNGNVPCMCDAIPVSRYNYVEAFVVGSIGCGYIAHSNTPFDGNGSGIMKEEFVVTRQIVESLDKDTFNVYILKESESEISYEIINKNL